MQFPVVNEIESTTNFLLVYVPICFVGSKSGDHNLGHVYPLPSWYDFPIDGDMVKVEWCRELTEPLVAT